MVANYVTNENRESFYLHHAAAGHGKHRAPWQFLIHTHELILAYNNMVFITHAEGQERPPETMPLASYHTITDTQRSRQRYNP